MQPADTTADRDRSPRRVRGGALAAAAALTALALLVAGCGGGGSSPGVANVSNSKTTTSDSSTNSGDSTNSGGSAPGGGSAPSTSSGSGPRTGIAINGGSRANALKLSECMRANGVPNFPDPNDQGVIQGTGFNPTSPAFRAAMNKCKRYEPNGGRAPSPQQQAQIEADALRFSQCMRSHGVTGFPDPQFGPGGNVSIRIGPHSGTSLDPNSPIFRAAIKACQSNLPNKGKGLSSAGNSK